MASQIPCPECSYDLRGLNVDICPECGADFRLEARASRDPNSTGRTWALSRRARMTIAIVLPILLLALVWVAAFLYTPLE